MAAHWLRLWHDMPNDPKWRTISRVSGQPIPSVIAVYIHLLVSASNATERGRTHGVCSEDLASALDLEADQIEAILSAMQGRVLEGDIITGWAKRQVEREDGAAERAKRWREAKKHENRTQPNAAERNRTPDKDKDKDTDKEKRKIKTLGDLSIADDEAFKAFWAAYPRKTNQAAARRAWKKHGPGILPVVFADIEARFRAGDWAEDRKEFIPHPATYLNGSRWLDDIIPRGQSNGASRPIDKPRSPADRLRAIRAAEQAERESHGQIMDGDAEHFRPPVREQLRHDTIGGMGYDPGRDHPGDDGRRN